MSPPDDSSLDCGWCSPDPAVYGNGSEATQCMDHTSSGWNCFHQYSHDGCVAGYTCDPSRGLCVQAAPGEGDTLENCEEACSLAPSPTPKYSCNAESFTCELDDSASTEQSACDSACADETPAELIGLWRGLNVQTGFTVGEWVMNFTQTSVSWGIYGDPVMVTADVSIIAPSTLQLSVTAGADDGTVLIATYTNPGYPTGPETQGMSIAIQKSGTHQAPPQNTVDAMGNQLFNVFVMLKCNSWGTSGCDFSAAFQPMAKAMAAPAAKSRASFEDALIAASDPCNSYADCDTCLADPSGVCGWCDGEVTDTDGNVVCGEDGNGCCGGSSGFSQCNVAFRKTCPVVCDYTDWLNPSCRSATSKEINAGTQTYEDCDAMPWCTNQVYQYCDETALQCKTVYSEADCEAAPDCDVNNPICDSTTCKQTTYIFCDPVLGCTSTTDKDECDANPACDSSNPSATCDPTVCTAQLYYTCDSSSLQCTPHTGPFPPTPYFNTTADCTAACVDKDLSGIWRGLRVDSKFVGDEWDFSLGSTTIAFVSRSTGNSYSGTYLIGDAVTGASYPTATITVTLSTGVVLKGVISNDRDLQSAIGPITKFVYLALPSTSSSTVSSFDAGMASGMQEYVLMACLDNGIEQGCDFSGAYP